MAITFSRADDRVEAAVWIDAAEGEMNGVCIGAGTNIEALDSAIKELSDALSECRDLRTRVVLGEFDGPPL